MAGSWLCPSTSARSVGRATVCARVQLQKQTLLTNWLQYCRIVKAPITAFCLKKMALKPTRCHLQLCHTPVYLTAPLFGQLMASLLCTRSFCFIFLHYYTFCYFVILLF